MKLFLAYASEDKNVAEEIQLALQGDGHDVFFDQNSLPPAGNYHLRIEQALQVSDAMVFLISPNSVEAGSYTVTELECARKKWAHPASRVLPVFVQETPDETIPPYLKAVTYLKPKGNIAAAVRATVAAGELGNRPSPPRDIKPTGDEKIDAVLAALVALPVDSPGTKRLAALSPLFQRPAFYAAPNRASSEWGEFLYPICRTRILLESQVGLFVSPETKSRLSKAIQHMVNVQHSIASLYGPEFSVSNHIGKFINSRTQFIAGLPPLVKWPDPEFDMASNKAIQEIRIVLEPLGLTSKE